jgi:hypothetical protein
MLFGLRVTLYRPSLGMMSYQNSVEGDPPGPFVLLSSLTNHVFCSDFGSFVLGAI